MFPLVQQTTKRHKSSITRALLVWLLFSVLVLCSVCHHSYYTPPPLSLTDQNENALRTYLVPGILFYIRTAHTSTSIIASDEVTTSHHD